MTENLRTEAIQVAAVAHAMVVDMDSGSTRDSFTNGAVHSDIRIERQGQEEKWGPQHHDPFTWLLILMEEVGELAEEIEVPGSGPYWPVKVNALSRIVAAGREARSLLETEGATP